MASVSSLDKDLAKLRLGKYTPQAANEVKSWIENTLEESLGDDDLMDCLHDGTVLCRLANKLIPNSAKYKQSAMPFVQMENIALFLRILSEQLKLPPHDLFLTVDLYEYKDPAQVLQTIGAFSRVANSRNPSAFPFAIGPKSSGAMSPSATGKSRPPIPSKTNVSSWSKPSDEHSTAPAWNIHQYGYMGGASQGSQGVVMGGRRQITSAGPYVPSLREKEERRKQQIQEQDEAEARRTAQEAEEERARQRQEEELWLRKEEEMRKQMKLEEEQAEKARRDAEAREYERKEREKRQLEEQEKSEREDRERRKREENEHQRKLEEQRKKQDRREYENFSKDSFQSMDYHHEAASSRNSESDRIKELERQLEEAKARERAYMQQSAQQPQPRNITPPNDFEAEDEREFLKKAWSSNNTSSRPLPSVPVAASRPLPAPPSSKPTFSKPPPHHTLAAQRQREMQDEDDAEEAAASQPRNPSPAPPPTPPRTAGSTSTTSPLANTRWGFKGSRAGSLLQKQNNAPSSTMSIVQREMEMERQRQKEWEQSQQQLAEDRKLMTDKELREGGDTPWDVNQYGYMGGANQGTEQVAFGARRQIIGPRNPK